VSAEGLGRCAYVYKNDRGVHELCPAEAEYAVEMWWPVRGKVEMRPLCLCEKHLTAPWGDIQLGPEVVAAFRGSNN
jgi:hypothetical protein